jgi:hypothetical protein
LGASHSSPTSTACSSLRPVSPTPSLDGMSIPRYRSSQIDPTFRRLLLTPRLQHCPSAMPMSSFRETGEHFSGFHRHCR